MLHLQMFGGLTLRDGGTQTSIGKPRRKPLAVLALIAEGRDRGVERDWIASMLWPELPEVRARRALAQALYVVRREAGTELLRAGPRLAIDTTHLSVDAMEFEALARHGNAARELERAVVRYVGPCLDGVAFPDCAEFDLWVDGVRARYARAFQGTLRELAARAAQEGDTPRAIAWLERAAHEFPLDSSIASALADAYVAAGRPGQADAHLRAHFAEIEAELGAAPAPELRDVARRVQAASAAPLVVSPARPDSRDDGRGLTAGPREQGPFADRAVIDTVSPAVAPTEPRASGRPRPHRGRRRVWALGLGLGAVLALGAAGMEWARRNRSPESLDAVFNERLQAVRRKATPHRGLILLRIRPPASGSPHVDSAATAMLAGAAEYLRRYHGHWMLSDDSVAALVGAVRADGVLRGEDQEMYEMLRRSGLRTAVTMNVLWYQDTLRVQLGTARRAEFRDMRIIRPTEPHTLPTLEPHGAAYDGLESVAFRSIPLTLAQAGDSARALGRSLSSTLASLRTCRPEVRDAPYSAPWCWTRSGELVVVPRLGQRSRPIHARTTRPPRPAAPESRRPPS